MLKVIASTWPLLLGVMLLMLGNGMQGSLLGIRGTIEGFTTFELSVVRVGQGGGVHGARFYERDPQNCSGIGANPTLARAHAGQ